MSRLRALEARVREARLGRRGERAAAVPAPTEPAPRAPAPGDFARDILPDHLEIEAHIVSRALYERLSSEDVALIERRVADNPELEELYAATREDEASRRHLALAFGAWLQIPAVIEKTGLSGVLPPEDVHSMVRGPFAAAGGLYESDLVVSALVSAGAAMEDVEVALDFGCSSGRVVATLAAAYPDVAWHGCDPNADAVAWAARNVPGPRFFVNADEPPLALADASVDLVYAISIWSHFAPALGLRWFEEMRRVVRPGGRLVFTTHGLTSVAFYAQRGLRAPDQCSEIRRALYREGVWYKPEFGEEGDWGVVNPAWGTTFLSPEWVLRNVCPRWRVLEFAAGRNQLNQDVYVLQRV